MTLRLVPLLSFVLVTTYTPGPNNISSTSMGVLYGYKRTLPYLLGITTGFLLLMVLCGLISGTLRSLVPAFETVLRIVGAAYILWLAYETLRATYTFEEQNRGELGFVRGALLQILNPKGVIYGLTLYSTFLLSLTNRPVLILLSAAGLSVVTFSAVSVWTLFGSAIRRFLHTRRVRRAVNVVLALALVYTAAELSGLLGLL
jgi:cysteine/O-acetylserine efflux protein